MPGWNGAMKMREPMEVYTNADYTQDQPLTRAVLWQAISMAHNLIWHDRRTHIEIDHQFINEKLDSGLIITSYFPSR
ncbi:hypothetical protein Lal_00027944 [Lupinus albus]|nr:hypothetical protein Lal_00027944 [Lupinus albus]